MNGKHLFKSLREAKDRLLERLKNYLEQRTRRQRLRIVLVAFVLFAVADIWMIARYVSGGSRPTEVRHIEVPLKP